MPENMGHLRSGESDHRISPKRVGTLLSGGVRIPPARQVHCDDRDFQFDEKFTGSRRQPTQGRFEARPDHSVDHQRRFGEQLSQHSFISQLMNFAQCCRSCQGVGGVTFRVRHTAQQSDVYHTTRGCKMARSNEPVATIISLAAEHDDGFKRRKTTIAESSDCSPGVLH